MVTKFKVSDELLSDVKSRFDTIAKVPTYKLEHDNWSDAEFVGDAPKDGRYCLSPAYDHPFMGHRSYTYFSYPIVVNNNEFYSVIDGKPMPDSNYFSDMKSVVLKSVSNNGTPYPDVVFIGKAFFERKVDYERFMTGETDYMDFFRFYDVSSDTHQFKSANYRHRKRLMDQVFLKRNEEANERNGPFATKSSLMRGIVERLNYNTRSVFNLLDMESYDLVPITCTVTVDQRKVQRSKIIKGTRPIYSSPIGVIDSL